MSRVGAKRHLPAAAAALVAGALGAGLAHGAGVSPRPVGFSAFLLTSCKRPETSAGTRRVSRVLRAARGRRGAAAPGGRRLVLGFPLSSPSGALRTGTVGVCPRPRVLHARAPRPSLRVRGRAFVGRRAGLLSLPRLGSPLLTSGHPTEEGSGPEFSGVIGGSWTLPLGAHGPQQPLRSASFEAPARHRRGGGRGQRGGPPAPPALPPLPAARTSGGQVCDLGVSLTPSGVSWRRAGLTSPGGRRPGGGWAPWVARGWCVRALCPAAGGEEEAWVESALRPLPPARSAACPLPRSFPVALLSEGTCQAPAASVPTCAHLVFPWHLAPLAPGRWPRSKAQLRATAPCWPALRAGPESPRRCGSRRRLLKVTPARLLLLGIFTP